MYLKAFKTVRIPNGTLLKPLNFPKPPTVPNQFKQAHGNVILSAASSLNILASKWLFPRAFSSAPQDPTRKGSSWSIGKTSVKGFTSSFSMSSRVEKEELAHLQAEAEKDPNNADKQLRYLQKLNQMQKSEDVINRAFNSKYAVSSDILYEVVRATLQKYPGIRQKFSSGTGTSPDNPLYILDSTPTPKPGAWYYVRSAASALFLVLLLLAIYMSFFGRPDAVRGGGGISDLFQETYREAHQEGKLSFSDVIGNDEAKQELMDIVEYLKDPTKFTAMGAKLPKGILLVGPPGCGKTLLAKAVAGEAGVPFLFSSGSEFEEMLVGVGARRVRALFNKAKEKAPCIVFIDEIDAIGGRRDLFENRGGKMTLNQMLVELDGFQDNSGVVVIAATNIEDVLDPALVRPGRFDRKVQVSVPDLKARKTMIDFYLKDKKAPDVDAEILAKSSSGFSGADISNMVNTAAIMAVKRRAKQITMDMLLLALDDVMMGPARSSLVLSPETKRLTAYHEGGHALVALHLGQHSICKATLLPRGKALGMVSYYEKDEHLTPKETLMARLDVAMAGRVAEEMIYGPDKITGGAGSDFDQATRMAYAMVSQLGFSEKMGPLSLNSVKTISDEMRKQVDDEVQDILKKSYDRAKKLLTKHSDQLHRLAEALIEFETLTEEEIKVVVEGKNLAQYRENKAKELEKSQKITITVPPTPLSPNISSITQ